jgi:flagellar protein FlaG
MDIRALGSGVPSGTSAAPPVSSSESSSNTASTNATSTNTSSTNAASSSDGAAVVSSTQAEPSVSQVTKAVQKINASPVTQAQGIEFSIDSTSHKIVVKIVDQSNNEVIRQIPSKQALAIADALDNTPSQGLLIQQQA